eukprot:171020_1
MAATARAKTDEKEFVDKTELFDKKITALAELVSASKHCIIFTGAGISTSCGIKDFRSGINTVLDTGAGIWAQENAKLQGININNKNDVTVKMLSA